MDTVSKNLSALVAAYKCGDLRAQILPSIYVIEPTNVCNLRCVMCPNSEIANKGFLDFQLFKSIVEEIRGSAKAVLLYLAGEPLLHADIARMIRVCKDRTSARVVVSTNGLLLSPAASTVLIDSGLDTLVVSVDGNSARTYESMRPGGSFLGVCRNIETFLEIREARENPELFVKMIGTPANRDEVHGFVQRWEQYRCTPLVSELSNWAGQYPVPCEAAGKRRRVPKFEREPCADLWFKMVINHTGDVLQCCYDFQAKHVLGNVRFRTICDIWNSPEIRLLRGKHRLRRYEASPLCKSCTDWSTEEDEYLYFPECSRLVGGRP